MSVPLKNMGVPLKKFVKSKAPLQNNSIVFDSTLEKITEEFHGSSIEGGGGERGDRGINCNSAIGDCLFTRST